VVAARVAAVAASIDPHAPHPGHRPTHWATCWRHAEHVKIVRGRAMAPTLARRADTAGDGRVGAPG
jgi:hypothetical protein